MGGTLQRGEGAARLSTSSRPLFIPSSFTLLDKASFALHARLRPGGATSAGFRQKIMKSKSVVAIAILLARTHLVFSADPKSGADDLKYSREVYGRIHMVAIAK